MIDRSVLKWIAVLTMVIDHVGAILFPDQIWMRVIGRVAFPVYAYCLAEGFRYTSDYRRYLGRLALFAILSEIPFDLAFYGVPFSFAHQNVFFTLTLGLILLWVLERFREQLLLCAGAFVVLCFLAQALHMDYGAGGLLMVFAFYLARQGTSPWIGWGIFVFINLFGYAGGVQWAAIIALLPIGLYSGKAGKKKQRFFYWIYPLHLLLLWIIEKYIRSGSWI
ncbi:MAG: TraX family protein [Lachnospiraceae bacterium]